LPVVSMWNYHQTYDSKRLYGNCGVTVARQCNPSIHVRAGTYHGTANGNDEKAAW